MHYCEELFSLWKMPFKVHSLVQDADDQDVALWAEHIEDYVMPAVEAI